MNFKNEPLQHTIHILDTVFREDKRFADIRTVAYNLCRPYRKTSESLIDIVSFLQKEICGYEDCLGKTQILVLCANLVLDLSTNRGFWLFEAEQQLSIETLDTIINKLKTILIFS